MRDYVADQLTAEQFDLYQMYAAAGVDEYSYMSMKDAPRSLQELREFARRSGKQYGPGKCLWADEFALRTVSDGLHLTILIVDDQAKRVGGSTAKRKRSDGCDNGQTDGRFVSIGKYRHAVILHRSRREHYNGVVVDGVGTVDLRHSPLSSLWRIFNEGRTETTDEATVLNRATAIGEEKSTAKKSVGKFYCGCAGFSNSNWVGNFYPKMIVGHNSDRQLTHYQEHFSTVEVNSTFYGVPSESTVIKWKGLFSKAFKLVVKAPRGVTHEHEKLNSSTLVYFLTRMEPLRDVLTCILIQCPRTLTVDISQLEQLKTDLEEGASWYSGHLAFEFRNYISFCDAGVKRFLADNKWTFVVHPDSLERSTVGSSLNGRGIVDQLVEYEPQNLSQFASTCLMTPDSGIVYLRLHGTNDEHRGEYNAHQLQEISEQINRWRVQDGLDVYCFFLNDLEPISQASPQKYNDESDKWSAMPKNAKQLEKLVFGLTKEQIPDAPKKPKATLLSFFAKK
jgi:uncharacterized protein YecE (DUF72 family)